MKTSFTFIASFIAAIAGFSPVALGKAIDFPKSAELGKHCAALNLPDHEIAIQQTNEDNSKYKDPKKAI